ncbi:MAG: hypothetical protein OEV93_01810 [Candidatus Moranbacteria bacterium]|nr:hypothetical protein [Candidatus Moranbacteria bacterium]
MKNKNVIISVILLSIALIAVIGIFYSNKNSDENQATFSNEEMHGDFSFENNEQENSNLVENESENVSEESEENVVTEYINERYGYSMRFPGGWYMNNDYSEAKIKEEEADDDLYMKVGGQTFWSNYSNMNDYSPSDKPDDFHIIALSVYEDESETIEKFAEKLEFDEDSKKNEFEAEGINGMEFVAPGLISGNPRVAVIFKKDNLFYVFNLAFIGGDAEVGGVMEGIVATFSLR